jgi:NSS family neurotransmitter:Na+ symporter
VVVAEYVIGRRSDSNAVGAFKKLAPKTKWWGVGMMGVISAAAILSFYGVVAGWTFEYLYQSSRNAFVGKSPEELTGMFNTFVQNPFRPLIWQISFMMLTCLLIYSGVKKGVERYTEILMPLLFVVIVLLAIRAITLPGGGEGVRFLFHPDFSAINSDVILSALGHAFFSLSLGLGALITYGSYVGKKENLISISIQVVILDTVIAILAGLAIFPAVFAYGIEPSSGPSLVFITLPNVFQQMPGGTFWGILFFLLLAVAALTSSVSLLEVVTAYVSEELKMKRHTAIMLSGLVITVLGVFCSLSLGQFDHLKIFGYNIFDFLDKLSANWLLPFGGLLTSLFVGWKMSKEDFLEELSNGGQLKVRAFALLRFVLRWVAPIAILLVFMNKLGWL